MSVPRLKMVRGPEPGREFELIGDVITVGRGTRNEIIIRDNEVSKEHCRLVRVLDDYEIHDLQSTNGTFVNGKRIDDSGWLLSAGNLVELGFSILLEFIPGEPTGDTSSLIRRTSEAASLKGHFYLIMKRAAGGFADEYALETEVVTIGRSMDNDIVIPEPEVSKQHMRLTREDNTYTLVDLGSLNGTYVNDVRVEEAVKLRPGDIIKVGTKLEMRFSDESMLKTRATRSTGEVPKIPDTTPSMQRLRPAETLVTKVEPLDNHIFLAYARSDWESVVSKFFAYLHDSGVAVWVDQYLVPESDSWNRAMEQALTECLCLVVVLSPDSVNTAYVRRAINRFIARDKPVVLLRYGDVNLPMMLQKAPAALYDPKMPEQSFRKVLGELLRLNVPRQTG